MDRRTLGPVVSFLFKQVYWGVGNGDDGRRSGPFAGAKRLAAIDRWWFQVESAFNLLAAFFIFGVMLLGVVQVIGRSFFNQPVRGYVDIVEIAITVFAFLAISYCQRLAGHVRMEIIIGRF